MCKELIITIGIIFVIIVMDIITQGYTNRTAARMNNLLNELEVNIVERKNYTDAQSLVSNIEEQWKKRRGIMVLYIEHDELEKVGTQISEIKGNLEAQQFDQSVAYINNCKFLLDHIKEKEAFTLKNIF